MRDDYEDDYYAAEDGGPPGWRHRLGERFSTWLGATLAILVIGGLALWSYRLGQRDATAVPVIRAALEPAKVQPEEPGGAKVPHQNITSYSAGSDEAPPTEITFAPPPERPAEEDVAMGALQESATSAGDGAGAATAPGETSRIGQEEVAPPDAADGDATDLAPEQSPVVRSRPGNLKQRMATARQAISEEAELASRAAASPVQIQLGAFPDRKVTKSEWERIYRANEDILQGRALVVQSTISGGRRFFRLRAGPFKNRIEAQNVCRALQARGQDCLVAVNG